jgi:hypothetical protein
VANTRRERITLPHDIGGLADDTEREFTAASSDIRRVLPIAAVPWLIATHEEILALPLDGRAGFVLSLIDGRCTVEMILDIAGLPEDEAIDILNSLRQLGVIELHDSQRAPRR